MKINFTKLTLATALLLGYAGMASAHDWLNEPIGAGVGATDYFQVTCSDDGTGPAARLDISVHDQTAGAAILSLQAQKGLIARNTTDAVGGDGTYSPLVSVASGNGVYNVMVDKKIAGARAYDIFYHCKTAGNLHTGTSIARKQNQ